MPFRAVTLEAHPNVVTRNQHVWKSGRIAAAKLLLQMKTL